VKLARRKRPLQKFENKEIGVKKKKTLWVKVDELPKKYFKKILARIHDKNKSNIPSDITKIQKVKMK
jgi:hypothetical protein